MSTDERPDSLTVPLSTLNELCNFLTAILHQAAEAQSASAALADPQISAAVATIADQARRARNTVDCLVRIDARPVVVRFRVPPGSNTTQ